MISRRMSRLNAIICSIVLFFWLLPQSIKAQDPPPPPTPTPAVPIDGGLGILLAAGAALGAKKAWGIKNTAKGV